MARALGLLAVTSVYAFTHDNFDKSAACYASRYPDLRAVFCATGRCDTHALHVHYENEGRTEKRLWGCRAVQGTCFGGRSITPRGGAGLRAERGLALP